MNILLNVQGLMTRENLDMVGTAATALARSFNPQLVEPTGIESVATEHQVCDVQKCTELQKKKEVVIIII